MWSLLNRGVKGVRQEVQHRQTHKGRTWLARVHGKELDLTFKYNGEPSGLCGELISRCDVETGDPGEAVAMI